MTRLANYIEKVDLPDKTFVGTIAFRSEELTLPDGSKMALGIDDSHWILVYQEKPGSAFQVYECDWPERKIVVDKKSGGEHDLARFKKLVQYFFAHSQVEDLVTILPPQG
ncbi:MAG: hypothetical protein WC632_07115 [Candidatus Margulisiibacteriota bacterium]